MNFSSAININDSSSTNDEGSIIDTNNNNDNNNEKDTNNLTGNIINHSNVKYPELFLSKILCRNRDWNFALTWKWITSSRNLPCKIIPLEEKVPEGEVPFVKVIHHLHTKEVSKYISFTIAEQYQNQLLVFQNHLKQDFIIGEPQTQEEEKEQQQKYFTLNPWTRDVFIPFKKQTEFVPVVQSSENLTSFSTREIEDFITWFEHIAHQVNNKIKKEDEALSFFSRYKIQLNMIGLIILLFILLCLYSNFLSTICSLTINLIVSITCAIIWSLIIILFKPVVGYYQRRRKYKDIKDKIAEEFPQIKENINIGIYHLLGDLSPFLGEHNHNSETSLIHFQISGKEES